MIARWLFQITLAAILFAPFLILAIDLLRLAGVIDTPDPGLAKRVRPF